MTSSRNLEEGRAGRPRPLGSSSLSPPATQVRLPAPASCNRGSVSQSQQQAERSIDAYSDKVAELERPQGRPDSGTDDDSKLHSCDGR